MNIYFVWCPQKHNSIFSLGFFKAKFEHCDVANTVFKTSLYFTFLISLYSLQQSLMELTHDKLKCQS